MKRTPKKLIKSALSLDSSPGKLGLEGAYLETPSVIWSSWGGYHLLLFQVP
jgi:hypothetical protein